jgi:ADP-ribosylglycohydrolase
MPTLRERIEGGLLGLLVGDALGVPYEFHEPSEIPSFPEIEMVPPAGFRRAHARVPPGTWSDDGAQALILLSSLLDQGRLDLDDFGRLLVDWYDDGFLAVDGTVFDVGIQTAQAIRRLRDGAKAAEAGRTDEQANGNGSLMRVLPLALWHEGADTDLVADAHRQSIVTHGHLRSQVCCALYCLWARRTLEGAGDPWREAVSALRAIYGPDSPETAELEWGMRPDLPPGGTGSGYVVDCLRSALWAVGAGGYEAVVKAAISLGRDTDTTACLAGGIAGLRDGVEAIPARWREGLRGRDLADPLLGQLVERRARS